MKTLLLLLALISASHSFAQGLTVQEQADIQNCMVIHGEGSKAACENDILGDLYN